MSAGVARPLSSAADSPCTWVVLNAPIWVLENSPSAVVVRPASCCERQRIGLRGGEGLDFGRAERADLRRRRAARPGLRSGWTTCVSVRRSIAVVLRTRSCASESLPRLMPPSASAGSALSCAAVRP